MERFGNFSSSEIWKLTTLDKSGKSFGKPALTYIKEKAFEKLLERPLSNYSKSKETGWGNICELQAFNLLGIEYKLVSKERIAHTEIANWNGMPDNIRQDRDNTIVGDIKCPFTLKSFIEQMIAHREGIESYKKEFSEYYWQLVSNAILTNSNKIECILYVPYFSELNEIRKMADMYNYTFLNYLSDEEIPYLLDGGKFKNINSFVYDLDKNDVDFLTQKVIEANNLLELELNK